MKCKNTCLASVRTDTRSRAWWENITTVHARKFHKFLPESFKQESFIYLCGVGPGEQGVGSA